MSAASAQGVGPPGLGEGDGTESGVDGQAQQQAGWKKAIISSADTPLAASVRTARGTDACGHYAKTRL